MSPSVTFTKGFDCPANSVRNPALLAFGKVGPTFH
jgi:hypothetical protein